MLADYSKKFKYLRHFAATELA